MCKGFFFRISNYLDFTKKSFYFYTKIYVLVLGGWKMIFMWFDEKKYKIIAHISLHILNTARQT